MNTQPGAPCLLEGRRTDVAQIAVTTLMIVAYFDIIKREFKSEVQRLSFS